MGFEPCAAAPLAASPETSRSPYREDATAGETLTRAGGISIVRSHPAVQIPN
jgi:hypothetical protein